MSWLWCCKGPREWKSTSTPFFLLSTCAGRRKHWRSLQLLRSGDMDIFIDFFILLFLLHERTERSGKLCPGQKQLYRTANTASSTCTGSVLRCPQSDRLLTPTTHQICHLETNAYYFIKMSRARWERLWHKPSQHLWEISERRCCPTSFPSCTEISVSLPHRITVDAQTHDFTQAHYFIL